VSTVFVSDLHLGPERPAKLELFERLLAHAARHCEALYVLGDLFEYWVGDDDDAPPHPRVIEALAALTRTDTKLFVMHGNRDFLIGERFVDRTGCRLLDDPTVIDLYGVPTLLMHGDLLCTRDVDYQALRRTVRDPAWQRAALARPLVERRALAGQMRDGSRAAMNGKSETIMDVEPDAVDAALRRHDVLDLIHGHTHRPAVHEFVCAGRRARRTVLGDWYELDSVLACEPGGRQRLLRVEDLLDGA